VTGGEKGGGVKNVVEGEEGGGGGETIGKTCNQKKCKWG